MPASAPPVAPATATPSAVRVWAFLGVVYVVWGSTYLAIRVVVDSAPPLLSMGARFLAAAGILALLLRVRLGAGALGLPPRQAASAALVGALLLLCGNGGVALAEQSVPSGLAALLVATTPLWLVLLRTGAGDRPRPLSLLGTTLGFVGIAVLARPGSTDAGGDAHEVELWATLLVVGAAAVWAVGSFASGRLPMPANPFVATTWEMGAGGALLVLGGLVRGEGADLDLSAVEPRAWAALAYLVVVGSVVGFSAYVWLLHNAPLPLVATYAYVNPAVAVVLGALLLSEPVTAAVLLGGAVVVVGVALVVTVDRPRSARGEVPAVRR